jgi:hypothetical protein
MRKRNLLAGLVLASLPIIALGADQGGSLGSNTAFNPAVSLILSGQYASFSNDPSNYVISGISPGGEAGPGDAGLGIGESELTLSSNVDNLFYGEFTASLAPDDTVSIEQAFFQTLNLPAGLTVQAGRFKSGFGYENARHAHTWDFADAPLVYRALMGTQYADDGVQARWLAPTDRFIEVGGELMRGDGYPAGGAAYDGTGAWTLFAHTGGDVGSGSSWRAGLSWMAAHSVDRESGDTSSPDKFTGDTSIAGIDFVWKWAPNRNPNRRNLKIQAEWLQRHETGAYTNTSSYGSNIAYDARQTGWYLQGAYQFMPRWRIGLRYDWLKADDPGASFSGSLLDPGGHTPQRASAMVDFTNSEFSRLRLQYNADDSGPVRNNELYLQYIMSLGAHGAHRF